MAEPCQLLDGMTVAIACREVHPRIYARGVRAQHLLDGAQCFNELAPIDRDKQTQATNAIADGNLVGRLTLGIRLHKMRDGQARIGQPLLNPGQGQRQFGSVPLQAARKHRYK